MIVSSPSVVILLLVSFVSLPHFNNASFLSYACSKAAAYDDNINRDFCVTSLQADPKSASTNNSTGLVHISINLAIRSVTRTISHINYLRLKPAYAHLKDDLCSCQDQYSEAINGLFDSDKQINSSRRDESNKVVWSITGAMTAMDDCQNEITDKSVLSKDHADAFQLCAMALTFHNKDVFT